MALDLPLTLQLPALLSLMFMLLLLSLQAPNMAQNAHGMATNFKGKRVKNSYELGATATLSLTGTGNSTASATRIGIGMRHMPQETYFKIHLKMCDEN